MKLLLIYGAPAVGKLTVAREVAKRTMFPVFHNHLTHDLAAAIYTPFSPPFVDLYKQVQITALRHSAAEGIAGMLLTLCYSHPGDDEWIDELQSLMRDSEGEICFIRLHCDREENARRVTAESRSEFQKLKSVEGLARSFERWNFSMIPNTETLSIDNTEVPAAEVAEQIIRWFDLPTSTAVSR